MPNRPWLKLKLAKVAGDSMFPAFCHSDFVLSFAWRKTRYRQGDVVIARHPKYQILIKRIAKLDANGNVLLAGDNPASTSSEAIGWLPQSALQGRVVWRCAAPVS